MSDDLEFHIPYTRSPWDEIVPGLWIGCHDYDGPNGERMRAVVGSEFDLVVSLFKWPFHGPDEGIEERYLPISDNYIEPWALQHIEKEAENAYWAWRSGRRVLVRCRAGLNRSALVVGLMLLCDGYPGREAVDLIREKRSPYALCNRFFESYLLKGGLCV